MTSSVRVRFAPSPTGSLHVGSFRTTLYAWLFARHTGGKFLLRIEDTDQERKIENGIRAIIEELQWFGIDIDEGPTPEELKAVGEDWAGAPPLSGPFGPYIQSLRKEKYKEIAERLVETGHAYRCDMTAEQLEAERQAQIARGETPGYSGYSRNRNVPASVSHVVRFKIPIRQTVVLDDAVKGKVRWESPPLRDPVLMKSDGFPTYHLAVVVDDHAMEITHVMRADEWLPTAPLHVMLYDALGWERPVFAHLPPVLGPSGKKLSKRDGATSTSSFREEGYLPEALTNYLALIGWSPGEGEEQEIFSIKELIEHFTLERVHVSGGVFDYNKLGWMNGVYIRNLAPEEFLARSRPFILKQFPDLTARIEEIEERLKPLAPLVQERVKTLNEVPGMVEFLFAESLQRDFKSVLKKGITSEIAVSITENAANKLAALQSFTHDGIEKELRSLSDEMGIKVGPLFSVLRIGALGKSVTPPLFESMAVLGQDVTVGRLRESKVDLERLR